MHKVKSAVLQNFLVCFLLLIVAVFSIVNENYLTPSNMMVILRQASLLGLLGIAQTMVIITGNIDLSLGSTMALTTVAFSQVIKAGDIHFILPSLGIVLMGAVLGYLNGLIVTRMKIPPFIATFATNYIYRGIAWLIMGSSVIYSLPENFRFFGTGMLLGVIPITIVFEIAVALLVYIILRRTRLGDAAYFVGANKKAAVYSGLNFNKTVTLMYTISGAIVAFTGVVYIARLNTAEPALGTSFALDSIATSLIGGTLISGGHGGVVGTMIGAIIIATIKNGMNFIGVSSELQSLFLGVIIILAVFSNQAINARMETAEK